MTISQVTDHVLVHLFGAKVMIFFSFDWVKSFWLNNNLFSQKLVSLIYPTFVSVPFLPRLAIWFLCNQMQINSAMMVFYLTYNSDFEYKIFLKTTKKSNSSHFCIFANEPFQGKHFDYNFWYRGGRSGTALRLNL